MGQNHSYQSNHCKESTSKSRIQIERDNWILLQKPEVNVTQMGNFAIYKNKVTGEVARQYSLCFDSKKQFQTYLDEFDTWRSQNHWNVIESKYLVSDQQTFSFNQLCSNYFTAKFFVENPVVTLSEIKDIPPSESFYILLSALVGFEHLFQIFGYFQVREPMITINDLGIVKVWINADLSKNRPILSNFGSICMEDIINPNRFIKELIQLVDSNTDYSQFQTSFKQYISERYDKKRVLTFGACRKQLLNFAQELKIDMPESLISILDLLFEKTNQSSISHNDVNNDHALYGKNYQNGYLLQKTSNCQVQQRISALEKADLYQEISNGLINRSEDQFESFQHFNQGKTQLKNQSNLVPSQIQQNKTESQSSNKLSSQPQSFSNVNEQNYNNFQIQTANNYHTYQMSNPYPQYQQQINYTHYSNLPQLKNQRPIFAQYNHQQIIYADNPYYSLIQRQAFEKQSTIRQQAEQDSFLTSYKNSKFQTSRDAKRASNYIKKNYKNIPTHRHTFSSQSDSKLNIQNLQNYLPLQIQVRQNNNQRISINQSDQSQQLTKRTYNSIQFYTPNQTKQLDAQIARDLQNLIASIKS